MKNKIKKFNIYNYKSKKQLARNVHYLCMISDVKPNIFTVTNVAVLNCGTSTLATDTDS